MRRRGVTPGGVGTGDVPGMTSALAGARFGSTGGSGSGSGGGGAAQPLREPKSHAGEDASARQRAADVIKQGRSRWLKNTEVCDILLNYSVYDFALSLDAPSKPGPGTLFLIDRRAVRFFRKDGHNWQKKKDGKVVRETHEKLKVGMTELLNCYYTHSEEDPRFQRRCYWLLNLDEGAVLVHYLRVKQIPTRSLSEIRERAIGVSSAKKVGGVVKKTGFIPVGPSGSPREGKKQQQQRQAGASGKGASTSGRRRGSRTNDELDQFLRGGYVGKNWASDEVNELLDCDEEDLAHIFQASGVGLEDDPSIEYDEGMDIFQRWSLEEAPSLSQLMKDFRAQDDEYDDVGSIRDLTPSDDRPTTTSSDQMPSNLSHSLEELERKLNDIRTRWVHHENSAELEEISQELAQLEANADAAARRQRRDGNENTTTAETSGDGRDESANVSSENGPGRAGGGVANRYVPASASGANILWSISDYTPSWDGCDGGAKVIITGQPVVNFDSSVEVRAVFGTKAVPVDFIAPNVLRCTAPPHPAGEVSMYLTTTTSGRHPISEIFPFEYRTSGKDYQSKSQGGVTLADPALAMTERDFQIRLVQLLTTIGMDNTHNDTRYSDDVTSNSFTLHSSTHMSALSALRAAARLNIDPYNVEDTSDEALTTLLSTMLKSRLRSVIVHENRRMKARLALPSAAVAVSQVEEVAKAGLVKDESLVELVVEKTQETQGALMDVALAPSAYRKTDSIGMTMFHCCAALGIDWAVKAMCATGVDLNHTDSRKRTALHWAVARGNEVIVASLLNAGAKTRCVAEWDGKLFTPAELAIYCGHEGIAAYISEATLSDALNNMNLRKPLQTGFQITRRTLPSDSEDSDNETLKPHGTVRRNSVHRRKLARSLDVPDEVDSDTEAVSIVKRAESARKKLQSMLRSLKQNSDLVDAHLGKRRTRRMVTQTSYLKEGSPEPAHADLAARGRRPAVRAKRLVAKLSPENTNSDPPKAKGDVTHTDSEDEDTIQTNYARIESVMQSVKARSQYLRLRRLNSNLQSELQLLHGGDGLDSGEDNA